MKKPIYLDYAATTPVDARVIEKMQTYLGFEGVFGNPASSTHIFGWEASEAVEHATKQVASLINANPAELVWTSGATESNNLAIKGAALQYQHKGRHIITLQSEHKAVLDACAALEHDGFEVTYLKPQPNGLVALDSLIAALRDDTILVSVMHVNNEIGVIQDIQRIGAILREKDILFHVDAAQSMGKLPIDVKAFNVDLMSLTAHKLYGPKGIGALYVCSQPLVRLNAQIHGGGHQKGMRSGTLPTHQIVGMGEACQIAQEKMVEESASLKYLRDKLWDGIKALPGIRLNGDFEHRIANNLNVTFAGVPGEPLILALKDLAISSSSACSSGSSEPSHVLRAISVSKEAPDNALRISVGRYTTEADIDTAIRLINEEVMRLQSAPCFWKL